MPGRPIGAVVGLYMDWTGAPSEAPTEGDYIVAEGQRGYGATYLIKTVRQVRSQAHPGRLAMRCLKLASFEDVPSDARFVVMRWYRRDRKRRDR